MFKLALAALSALLAFTALAVDCETLDSSFDSTVVEFDPSVKFRLRYKMDDVKKEITLSLSANLNAWLSVGFPEPSSGSMLGADVVTMHVDDATGEPVVRDRFVAWAAWPFYGTGTYQKNDASPVISTYPLPFPSRDCDNDGSDDWEIVESVQTTEGAETCTRVTAKRSYTTSDPNDRPIEAGLMKLIWAYGDSDVVTYHGVRRGLSSAHFIDAINEVSYDLSGPEYQVVPMLNTDYLIPTKETTYSSKYFLPMDGEAGDYHAVKFEPYVQPGMEPYVHHLVLYGCYNDLDYSAYSETFDPETEPGPAQQCYNVVYAWAVGGGISYVPIEAGFRGSSVTGDENKFKYMRMEIHYTNVKNLPNLEDSSGVIMTVQTGTLRTYDAGAMTYGAVHTTWYTMPANTQHTENQYRCPSYCTSEWDGPITIFWLLLHQHAFGHEIIMSKYGPPDVNGNVGEFRGVIGKISYWNFEFQQTRAVPDPIASSGNVDTDNQNLLDADERRKVYPGEEVIVTASFDTSKWPEPVEFKDGSFDEMGIVLAFYYPRKIIDGQILDSCGYGINKNQNNRNYTTCPKHNTFDSAKDFDGTIEGSQLGLGFAVAPPEPLDDECSSDPGVVAPGDRNSDDPNYDYQKTLADGSSKFYWRIQKDGQVKGMIVADGNVWVGFGLAGSSGNAMVGGEALVASTAMDVTSYQLNGLSIGTMVEKGYAPTSSSVEFTNGKTKFKFVSCGVSAVRKFATCVGRRRLADDPIIDSAIMAVGSTPYFGQHAKFSAFNLDWSGGDVVGSSPSGLKAAHAWMMVASWYVLAPISISYAALKPNEKWMDVHASLNSLIVLLTLVAIVLMIVDIGFAYSDLHHVLGFVFGGFSVIQYVSGGMRVHLDKDEKTGQVTRSLKRRRWEFGHKNLGRAVFLGCMANAIVGTVRFPSTFGFSFEPLLVIGQLAGLVTLIMIVVYVKKIRKAMKSKSTAGGKDETTAVSAMRA